MIASQTIPDDKAEMAERAISEVLGALEMHPWNDDYRLAPPHPYWPQYLPQHTTSPDEMETCFPYPSNMVLSLHLAYWDEYPGECQQRIDKGWHAKEELEREVLRGREPECTTLEGWPTWQVAIAVSLAVLVTGITAGATGYVLRGNI